MLPGWQFSSAPMLVLHELVIAVDQLAAIVRLYIEFARVSSRAF